MIERGDVLKGSGNRISLLVDFFIAGAEPVWIAGGQAEEDAAMMACGQRGAGSTGEGFGRGQGVQARFQGVGVRWRKSGGDSRSIGEGDLAGCRSAIDADPRRQRASWR